MKSIECQAGHQSICGGAWHCGYTEKITRIWMFLVFEIFI